MKRAMGWQLYRWVWELRSPLHIGMPPAGMLNRCRLYIPARVLWGALTAELARVLKGNSFPEYFYFEVGEALRKKLRLTYLFPATCHNGAWRAWLPLYEQAQGLMWYLENKIGQSGFPDRIFRRYLLDTLPGTAIDPHTDTAAEGTLRELECIMTHWRPIDDLISGPVAMVGYVLIREWPFRDISLEKICELHVGGDTRYGLGHLHLIEWGEAKDIFGLSVETDCESPLVKEASFTLAHACAPALNGALELILGWDWGKGLSNFDGKSTLWVPGSSSMEKDKKDNWQINEWGIWTIVTGS